MAAVYLRAEVKLVGKEMGVTETLQSWRKN